MELLKNNKKENLSLSFKIKRKRGFLALFGFGRRDDEVNPRTLRALFSRRKSEPTRLNSYRKGKRASAAQIASRTFFRTAA